ncbi:hypothetical protein FXO38_25278 [Capsicum annuum]|nr:hypothetical protein FXO38_25278 [Capsicum annuum]
MVDDERYSRFPWGKVAFEKLMASISRSMNEVQKFYRLSGLPYALQIWWYECCAKVDESLAVRVHNSIPRMLVYRNITPSPQEVNHLDLSNPLMFGSTDDAANVAQAVVIHQQSERTAPTEFGDEFDDFSTPPSIGLLKKMRLNTGQSSYLPAKKQKIVEESEKVAQYPVHESEKGNPNIEVDPPQSVNEHTTDAKSYNVVDAAGQSSKLGANEGATEESLKEAESSYVDKLQEDDRHITDVEVVEAIMKEHVCCCVASDIDFE